LQRSRIFDPDVIDQFTQAAYLLSVQFHGCAHGFRGDVVWIDGQARFNANFASS
jgi:hypothetical protein